MNILIYGNCQVNQLVLGLRFALLEKANVLGVDINNPKAKEQLRSVASGNSKADYVIANSNLEDLEGIFPKESIISIPTIHFGGFHPDVVYFANKQSPDKPLFYMKNPTISGLALWSVLNDVDESTALSLYNDEVFEALGYYDYFDVASLALLKNYSQHDIHTSYIEKHFAARDVFMYGPLHPKFEVTLSLCFGICDKLGIKPSMEYSNIDKMLPDPLQNEYAWGCFPPIAERLGIKGAWMVRHYNQTFPTMKHYLANFYKFMSQNNKNEIQFLERDKDRFENFHRIDDIMKRFV